AGGDSTIMPRSVSRRTRFLPQSGWRISPLSRWPSSRPLAYPNVSSRGALPVRPERHVPESIATIYRLLGAALARGLPCVMCGHQSPGLFSDTVVLTARGESGRKIIATGERERTL